MLVHEQRERLLPFRRQNLITQLISTSLLPTNVKNCKRTHSQALSTSKRILISSHFFGRLADIKYIKYSHQTRALPSKFAPKFTLNRQFHSYYTRNSKVFRLPFCRTNIKQFSVFYQGPKFYNSLNTDYGQFDLSNSRL